MNRFEFRVIVETALSDQKIIGRFLKSATIQAFPTATVAVHERAPGKRTLRYIQVRAWLARHNFTPKTNWLLAARLAKQDGLYSAATYDRDIAGRLQKLFRSQPPLTPLPPVKL